MTPLDNEIIKGMADHNLNISAVARDLYMHQNTVVYHIERVKRETGLNARNFYDLAELLAMIDKGEVGTDEARAD